MRYLPDINDNIIVSSTYKEGRTLNGNLTEDQRARIQYWAENTVPPSAPNAGAVTENCQHWAVRVLSRLQNEGIVTQGKVKEVAGLVQPLA
jgi:hypothetical protein